MDMRFMRIGYVMVFFIDAYLNELCDNAVT